MYKSWTLYKLATPIGTEETPYHLSEGELYFRALPFFASNVHSTPPEGASVSKVWEDYDKSRLAILGGLDWATSMRAHVYQLSLQLLPSPYGEDDPLKWGLSHLVREQKVIVVAAGNSGSDPGTLSALARIPGVISVGATTPGGQLLGNSSRGTIDGPIPTLACDGTDPWPEPFAPGTSFAASRVADLCVFLRPVLAWLGREFAARREQAEWPPGMPGPSRLAILDTGVHQDAILKREAALRQLIAAIDFDAYNEYIFGTRRAHWMDSVLDALPAAGMQFEFTSGPATIRRLLQAVASREICDDPLGCGAGFLLIPALFEQLTALTPSRFQRWFGVDESLSETQKQRLEALDCELGPLWDATTVDLLRHEYLDKANRIYGRVL